jgi:hypothetical protein
MTVDEPTTSQETEPEQPPAAPRLALAEPPAPAQHGQLRPLAVAQCSMCGIALPLGLLVPDGGEACADIRWYCKDARSCTDRWTTAGPRTRALTQAVPGSALADAGEAAQGEAAQGEAAQGEAAQGEAAQGEAAQGEAAQGEAPAGQQGRVPEEAGSAV